MWRRASTMLGYIATVFAFANLGHAIAGDAPDGKQRVYIGAYNSPQSVGIYQCELDLATGKLSEPKLACRAVNPSFLAIHPNRKYLYAVSEVATFDGKTTGAVAAFSIDNATGSLAPLNQESSGGAGPCHLIVDHAGTHVLVANYSGGNAAVLPVGPDGRLSRMSNLAQHAPSGGTPDQPKRPLAHSINLDPSGRFAFVGDAGVDKVFIYRYDAKLGSLAPNEPPAVSLPANAAPRHFAFHPDGRHAYAINESELSVTAFDFNRNTGALTPIQTISTVPDGAKRQGFSTAEVVVHPSGKFLYGSNRGYDSIAGFRVDSESGKLTAIGQFAKGDIKTPRNFNIDPTGAYALVAGQDSDNIVVYRIDPQTGAFQPTGSSISIGKPVCIKFYRR